MKETPVQTTERALRNFFRADVCQVCDGTGKLKDLHRETKTVTYCACHRCNGTGRIAS